MSRSVSLKAIKRKTIKDKVHCNSVQEVATLECAEAVLATPVSTARSPCSFRMDNRGRYLGSDEESEPDRSNPAWKPSPITSPPVVEEQTEKEEIENRPSIWEEIMEDYENERTVLKHLNNEKRPFEPEIPIQKKLTAVQYLQQRIFPILCPALEDMLFQAKKEECLQIQKCVFNGLDYISELLWNMNPMHPKRKSRGHKRIFDIPFVKLWLHEHPRPIYPLSWVWTKEEAIIIMQSYIRRYFVCREPNCYEMRKFWQVFKQEKREEEYMRELKYYEEVHEIASSTLSEILALAVYKAELKIHGCFCIAKPCLCKCRCFKWCKCCQCYRPDKSVAQQFYSNIVLHHSKQSNNI